MALSLNEQKQLQLDSQRKLAQAKSPLEKLRYTCLCRGASGINGIGRQFRIIDDDNNKLISKEEFVKVCHDFRVGLTNDEIDGLFAEIDRDGSGSINFDEFLEALRVQCGFYLIFQPPMSENRKKIIELVFNKMDKTGDGVITASADDLRGVYNVRSHPKYLNGELSEKDVLNEYLKTFESRGEKDGKVTWQEFLNYYSAVSSSIDDDVYFDLMLRNAYKL
ncbi:Calcyphosin-like protein [Echinococcus granulosus]|uniref:Calcyphosin protein n=1 Tax=Echinococcus granulosus TaxID=6210 RepID=A0A068WEE2_ECHGR|nr:Calcyphosin-like protein [Echinococcus granulosus]CDS18458.1 calcyphosin protein [Echinococcus granulosus]